MNRANYFNFIEEKLCLLALRIEMRGGLNILDHHLHSENFYLHFFNLLFDWQLLNINTVQQNAAGIDLIDTTNKIIVQVSATATKQKIESALAKDLSIYQGYSFKFISISKNAKDLRTKKFMNPHNLIFSPEKDIFDISSLLALIKELKATRLKEIYEFIKDELKSEPDPDKVESNLTTIIKILSKVDWEQEILGFETVPFDIEAKITYNQLDTARILIDEYKIHHSRINKIYSDFNKQGVNKSFSILNGIRSEYLSLNSVDSPDQCFFTIIKKVVEKIRASANYTPIPDEELELCVQILVVDVFIRCKIFENPIGNNNACS
ncbi:MAG: SMEK domain-containing protein [Sedimentisphaerales bacterium]|nr:SMEK domain-containing protein [Sedimentisphaerales bacterium]